MTNPRSQSWLRECGERVSAMEHDLLRRAVKTLEDNILTAAQPLPWHPYRGIIPSPSTYRGIWNWDSAFHAVTVSRWDPGLAREQISIILDRQLPSGALPDVIFEDGNVVSNFGKPPVMPWACTIVDRRDADDAFLAAGYERFVPYEAHWRRNRGGGEDGLFHYDSEAPDAHQRAEDAKLESGWDDSVRWDNGCRELWPIDLNCFMVMLYRAMAYMAERVSRPDDRAEWLRRADRLAVEINDRLFESRTGAYVDRNRGTGRFTGVLTPASFMPLYVGIASKERAKRMASVAADPNRFFPGMPIVSYDNPAYSRTFWRGPTWLNTAYFALKGLKLYGYHETADACRQTILEWCARTTDAIHEYYDSRTGDPLGAKQFSWSAAFIIEFILNWNNQSDV